MSMSLKIVIENVRRLEHATLSIRPGSRTVIVGRNNAGKTTLLDMVTRALWSLPCSFTDNYRHFHISWYRRAGDRFSKPRATLTLPIAFLDSSLFAQDDAALEFELIGQHLETQVTRERNETSKLVATRCELHTAEGKKTLFRLKNPPSPDIWGDAQVEVLPPMFREEAWPIQPSNESTFEVLQVRALYDANTPLARALHRLAHRVIYLPASRPRDFSGANTFNPFNQGNMQNVASLLLSLQATARERFEQISVALSLLFPDVRRLALAPHPNGVVPEVTFTDGRTEQAGNLGFGFQNALHLFTVCGLCPPDAVLLVDEPEQGLNQSCQRDLGSVMEALRPDITLVIATQSEALCRGFSSSTSVVLVEAEGNTSTISAVDIANNPNDLRRLAEAMGLDPLFLSEGGRIIYVEGRSDELVIRDWMKSIFPNESHQYQVVGLGGCGRLGEEFVKPILAVYASRVFVLLDSDRASQEQTTSPDIARLVTWLTKHSVAHHVLKKRELENYLGAEAIARVAGIHPSALSGAPGHADWFDIKSAFEKSQGAPYDERRLTVGAFQLLDPSAQRNLFGEEGTAIVEALRKFVSG